MTPPNVRQQPPTFLDLDPKRFQVPLGLSDDATGGYDGFTAVLDEASDFGIDLVAYAGLRR